MIKKYVNLLPPEELKLRRQKELARELRLFAVALFGSLAVFIGVLAMSEIYLRAELRQKNERIKERTAELLNLQQESQQDEVGLVNGNLENFQVLQSQNLAVSAVLLEFGQLLPRGVTLDSFTLTREKQKIEVAGRALTREEVLELRQNLLASPHFRSVNFPLANLERARDVAWHYRFYLK